MKLDAKLKIERAYHITRGLVGGSVAVLGLCVLLTGAGIATNALILATASGFALMAGLAGGLGALLSWIIERRRARDAPFAERELALADGALVAGPDIVHINQVKLGWVDALDRVAIEHHNGDRWLIDGLGHAEQQRLLAHVECSAAQRALDTTMAAPYRRSAGCLRLSLAALLPILGSVALVSPCVIAGGLGRAWSYLMAGNLTRAFGATGIVALAAGVVMGVCWLMYRYYRPSRLRIGSDGIRYEKWLGSGYIPYRDVDAVEARTDGVTLQAGGREIALQGADEAVAQRIREAMATQAERRATGLRIERLDRSEDDVRAWKQRIEALATPSADYRDAGLDDGALLDVVEDPGASPEQRVAAAYALSLGGSSPRHRIAVAAQACADDDMRAALEEAAEGEIAARRVARAMERFGASG